MRACDIRSKVLACFPGLLFLMLLIQDAAQALKYDSLPECRRGNCNTWKLPPPMGVDAPWSSRRPGYSAWRSTSPYTSNSWKLSSWRFSPGVDFWMSKERTKPSRVLTTTSSPPIDSSFWNRQGKPRENGGRAKPPPVFSRNTPGPGHKITNGATPWNSEPRYPHLTGNPSRRPQGKSWPETSREHWDTRGSQKRNQTTPSPRQEVSTSVSAAGFDQDSESGPSQRMSESPYWKNRFRYQWSSGATRAHWRKTTAPPVKQAEVTTRGFNTRVTTPKTHSPHQGYSAPPTSSKPALEQRVKTTVEKSYSPYKRPRTRLPSWWYQTTQSPPQRTTPKNRISPTTDSPAWTSTTSSPEKSDSPYKRRKSNLPSWITRPTKSSPSRKTRYDYPSGQDARQPSRSWTTEAPKQSLRPTAARWIQTTRSPLWRSHATKFPDYRHGQDNPKMSAIRWPQQEVVTASPDWRPKPTPSPKKSSTKRPFWDYAGAPPTVRSHSTGDYSSDSRYGYPSYQATQAPSWVEHSTKSPYLRTRLGDPDWAMPTSLPYWKKATETPFWRRPTTPAWKAKLTEPDWKTESDGSHWSRWKTRPRPTTNYDALLEPTPAWDCEEDERTDEQRWRAMLYSLYGAWYQNGPLAPMAGGKR